MARIKLNAEFPCGYKINIEISTQFWNSNVKLKGIEMDSLKECPLHKDISTCKR